MIDFRYHLVSLISVFLALAVGVVLGAGPLQNSLGTALNDQVTSLRTDRNSLQAKLEQTSTAVNERDSYIAAAAQSFIPGTLTGRSVAVVVMPEAKGEDIDAVIAQIEAAGGTINGRYQATTAWADVSRETFRSTYSGQFTGYMDSVSSTDGNTILGQGLGGALTTEGDKASALMDLLTASETPLITIDATATGAANAIVVIGPRSTTAGSNKATASADSGQDPSAWSSALIGTATAATTVVVGAADAPGDVVATLRSADAAVTTIDSVGQVTAAVSTPLALAATAAGTTGAYGFDNGADAVMPPTAS